MNKGKTSMKFPPVYHILKIVIKTLVTAITEAVKLDKNYGSIKKNLRGEK